MAVISHWLWQNRLGEPHTLPDLWVNGTRLRVVGVGPPGFRGHFKGFNFDLFLPVGMGNVAGIPDRDDRSARWVEMVGRLAADVKLDHARSDLERRGELMARNHPAINADLKIEVERMTGIDADFRGGLVLFLSTLLAISGLVLLIACINVASMMLSRTVARQQELAVRRALGAPRLRLARQLLTESAVLALLSGGLGVLLALWATRLVASAFSSVDSRMGLEVHVDGTTLLVTVAVCLGVAVVAGLSPGLQAGRSAALPSGDRALAPHQRWRRLLVIGQVVLSFVVLVSASLFLRALRHATAIDTGFSTETVLAATIAPGLARLEDAEARSFFREILARTEALPGVEAAALISRLPLGLGARFFPNPLTLGIPGWQPPAELDGWPIEHTIVTPGLLGTLGIPLLEGRELTAADREPSAPVALVNQTFAERFFASTGAVGQTLHNEGRELQIVGVVRDAKYRTLDEGSTPFVYLPFEQRFPSRATLVLRPRGDPQAVADGVRAIARELAPGLPAVQTGRLEERMASAFLPQRIGAATAGSLGILALLLSAVGLYGVLAHWVAARKREIGLRISLGAAPQDVLRLVLRQGVGMAGLGVALGVPAAALGAQLFASFLYGLSPVAPVAYLSVGTVLLATASVASLLPAARAARVDPLVALRED